ECGGIPSDRMPPISRALTKALSLIAGRKHQGEVSCRTCRAAYGDSHLSDNTALRRSSHMTKKQKVAARKNIEKAAQSAKRKRTIANLPAKTRTALGKEGAKTAKKKK